MRFWDSSAIVPLIVREPRSTEMRALLDEDERMLVWWATGVECVSALRRLERAGTLGARDVGRSVEALRLLDSTWSEVTPAAALRARAERLLAVHPLRAADALQLAAALAWRRGDPAGAVLVTLDDRLRDAAAREGFAVVPAP